LILSFQIPQKLRTRYFSRRMMWTNHRPHQKTPNTQINLDINKHVCPHSAQRFQMGLTQRHQ
jgi:hypothetical protein